MQTLYGLYADPAAARQAAQALRGAGVDPRSIAVISSAPLEGLDLGGPEVRTPMPWLAALGGLLGGTAGYLLSSLTQQIYPLPTGGMPISPLWTNGIITYELTMFGAIVTTLITLLAGTRLPSRRVKPYDPAVSEGKILVGVVNPSEDSRVQIEGLLRAQGAEHIKEC